MSVNKLKLNNKQLELAWFCKHCKNQMKWRFTKSFTFTYIHTICSLGYMPYKCLCYSNRCPLKPQGECKVLSYHCHWNVMYNLEFRIYSNEFLSRVVLQIEVSKTNLCISVFAEQLFVFVNYLSLYSFFSNHKQMWCMPSLNRGAKLLSFISCFDNSAPRFLIKNCQQLLNH